MVAKTTNTKKTPPDESSGKSKTEIKASKGAWWKSTVTEKNDQPSDTSLDIAVDVKETAQPEKKRPTRTKRAVKKKPVQTTDVKTGKVDAVDSQEEAKPQTAKRPPRKRGPRKKKSDQQKSLEPAQKSAENKNADQVVKAVTKEPVAESAAESTKAKDTVVSDGKAATDTSSVADEPLSQAEASTDSVASKPPEKKKSSRPRRGRRGNKKQEEAKASPDGEREEDDEGSEVATDDHKEDDTPRAVRKLLINAEEPEECRLALLEEGRLECIYVSTTTRTHTKNNIYKARIVALEANLQAAFVDYGTEKNGFLPFGEIHPEYYRQDVSEKTKKIVEQHQWKKLSITDVLEKGQEVLVQVVKEEIGTKGANMTTYLSLPGRCVVLLPGSDSSGISRKISGEERRSQLRDIMDSMTIPEGIGWIVRTASNDINKTALSRDVNYLLRLWAEIKKKGQDMEGVGEIYQDHDSVLRFLRENFDPSIEEILVDNQSALEQVKGFIEILPPKQRTVKVKLHRGSRPIFNQYSIEDQIESIYQPRVNLPSGGSIVIDQTEALVAIDVNSGSTSKDHNFEASIFQANMEAAVELARQLRLRDLGGLIVIDFIDMRSQKNIREVEKQVKTAMKRDKAKVDISRISKFGLMQISRQKLGAPIDAGTYRVCEHCSGRGTVRSVETLALFYLRRIQTGASRKLVHQVECHFPLDVAQYLLNNKKQELIELEKRYDTEISIIAKPALKPAENEIIYHKREKEVDGKKQA